MSGGQVWDIEILELMDVLGSEVVAKLVLFSTFIMAVAMFLEYIDIWMVSQVMV